MSRLRALRDEARHEVLLGEWRVLMEEPDTVVAALVDEATSDITAPYLSLHGLPLPDGYGDWLHDRIPQAEIERFDGAGHWPHLADPDRFVARVTAFHAAT